MLNSLCGFLWGIVCTLLTFNICTSIINFPFWIWFLLFVILITISFIVKVYLYITDYKELATSGYSIFKKIANWIISKRNKNK